MLERGKKRPNFSCGRNRIGEQGILIEPTVLLNPNPDVEIYKKEVPIDDASNGNGGVEDAADLDHGEGSSSWKYFPI